MKEKGEEGSDKNEPKTFNNQTGAEVPHPRRIDLSNLRDVRLEMAEVYRRVDREEILSQDGSRRVFMLRQIADVIVNSELERRIGELEEQAGIEANSGRRAFSSARLN